MKDERNVENKMKFGKIEENKKERLREKEEKERDRERKRKIQRGRY